MFQTQVSQDRYDIIMSRYKKFIETFNDPEKEPVRVFDPLSPKQLEELQMIRELSRELQAKKEEDMRKAAEARMAIEEKEKKIEKEAPIEESKKDE